MLVESPALVLQQIHRQLYQELQFYVNRILSDHCKISTIKVLTLSFVVDIILNSIKLYFLFSLSLIYSPFMLFIVIFYIDI